MPPQACQPSITCWANWLFSSSWRRLPSITHTGCYTIACYTNISTSCTTSGRRPLPPLCSTATPSSFSSPTSCRACWGRSSRAATWPPFCYGWPFRSSSPSTSTRATTSPSCPHLKPMITTISSSTNVTVCWESWICCMAPTTVSGHRQTTPATWSPSRSRPSGRLTQIRLPKEPHLPLSILEKAGGLPKLSKT